jgi:hypothetical protein
LPPAARLNCAVIEGAQRDSTQDWVVPRGTVPTVAELEARIDEAVVIARASEEGVREVGEMALDAAQQARRAAALAEMASAAAVEAASKAGAGDSSAGGPAGPVPDLEPPSLSGWSPKSAPPPGSSVEGETPRDEKPREVVIDPLTRFNRRADAIAARLTKLQQVPV